MSQIILLFSKLISKLLGRIFLRHTVYHSIHVRDHKFIPVRWFGILDPSSEFLLVFKYICTDRIGGLPLSVQAIRETWTLCFNDHRHDENHARTLVCMFASHRFVASISRQVYVYKQSWKQEVIFILISYATKITQKFKFNLQRFLKTHKVIHLRRSYGTST